MTAFRGPTSSDWLKKPERAFCSCYGSNSYCLKILLEPAVFIEEVAKQHDVSSVWCHGHVITFGMLELLELYETLRVPFPSPDWSDKQCASRPQFSRGHFSLALFSFSLDGPTERGTARSLLNWPGIPSEVQKEWSMLSRVGRAEQFGSKVLNCGSICANWSSVKQTSSNRAKQSSRHSRGLESWVRASHVGKIWKHIAGMPYLVHLSNRNNLFSCLRVVVARATQHLFLTT